MNTSQVIKHIGYNTDLLTDYCVANISWEYIYKVTIMIKKYIKMIKNGYNTFSWWIYILCTFLMIIVTLKIYSHDIVTCQPIVGLGNRALLGSRPVNNSRPNTRYAIIGEAVFSPHRALLYNRPQWRHTASRSFPRQLRCKHGDLTQHSSHLAHCCSDTCTIEGFIRGTGMFKQPVFKKQLFEPVVK
jgi:hypothetical protein